jgi:hypothetical protein
MEDLNDLKRQVIEAGLKLVEKGRRNGQEVSWKQILSNSAPAASG